MAKRKTQKINSRNKTVNNKTGQLSFVEKKLPDGHRYDDEIEGIAYGLLVSAHLNRIEKLSSMDRSIKIELRKKLSSRRMSRIASDYYQRILDLAQDDPLTSVCLKIIEVIHDEYCHLKKHMDNFNGVVMADRIKNLMGLLLSKGWFVDSYNEKGLVLPDEPFLCMTYHEKWEVKVADKGGLLEPMSIMARTEDLYDLVEMAYSCGIILFKKSVTLMHFHLTIYPENNIPGIGLKPKSLMKIIT
jgi:hypothetical protein